MLLLLFSLVLLAGCGCQTAPFLDGTNQHAGEAANDALLETITYAVYNEPQTADPASGSTGDILKILRNCYEPLVKETIGSLDLEPGLATEWEVSEDQKEWIFYLRENVKFTDGTTLTANDVKVTFERVLTAGLGGASLISSIESIEVVDENTVKMILEAPNVFFLYRIAKIPIVSATAIEQHEVDGDQAGTWLSRNTAGTGPWVLCEENWITGEYLELVRFDDYWGGWAEDKFDVVRIIFTNDTTVQMQMLERGEIDKNGVSIIDAVDRLQQNKNLQILNGAGLETDIITLNCQKYPLDNKDFRMALSYALDYEAVRDDIFGGYSDVPRGFLPSNFEGFNESIPSQEFCMEKAKEYLDNSGVDTNGLVLTMHLNKGQATQMSTAIIFQDALRQLGIELEITEVQWAVLSEEFTSVDTAPHMSILAMGAYTGDPIYFISSVFHSENIGAPYNWSFFSNSELDALLDEATATADNIKRNELLARAQQILVEEAPAIYYACPQKLEAISTRVAGYKLHPLDYYYYINFYDVSVAE